MRLESNTKDVRAEQLLTATCAKCSQPLEWSHYPFETLAACCGLLYSAIPSRFNVTIQVDDE